MEYCAECERWFQNAAALRQHRENSSRHMTAFSFGSTSVTTPTAPTPTAPVRANTQTPAFNFGMAPTGGLFRTWPPPEPATQRATACGTAEDDTIDTSKILIDSLKGYAA